MAKDKKRQKLVYQSIPTFKGEDKVLAEYIKQNTRYPEKFKGSGIKAKVYCEFVVDPIGYVTNICIKRKGPDPAFDEEAIGLFQRMPRWNPGTDCSYPKFVKVRCTSPVYFEE